MIHCKTQPKLSKLNNSLRKEIVKSQNTAQTPSRPLARDVSGLFMI